MSGSPSDRALLKQPFGTLVPQKDITKQKILSMLQGAKKIISIGDATTERLISFNIIPDIAVIDGVERRSLRGRPINYPAEQMFCNNPAGTISKKALQVLQSALETSFPVMVKVEGEEDMLALPLFIMAPKGSIVLYGQPLEGIVLVNITEEKQNEAKELMNKISSCVK